MVWGSDKTHLLIFRKSKQKLASHCLDYTCGFICSLYIWSPLVHGWGVVKHGGWVNIHFMSWCPTKGWNGIEKKQKKVEIKWGIAKFRQMRFWLKNFFFQSRLVYPRNNPLNAFNPYFLRYHKKDFGFQNFRMGFHKIETEKRMLKMGVLTDL